MSALTPTVLDTDPGIDDALALLLAWGSPELDVLALTVVAGNAPLASTARNAARLVAGGREGGGSGPGPRRAIDAHRAGPVDKPGARAPPRCRCPAKDRPGGYDGRRGGRARQCHPGRGIQCLCRSGCRAGGLRRRPAVDLVPLDATRQ